MQKANLGIGASMPQVQSWLLKGSTLHLGYVVTAILGCVVYGMLGILRCLYECSSMFSSSLEKIYIICSFLVRDAWRSVGCEIW